MTNPQSQEVPASQPDRQWPLWNWHFGMLAALAFGILFINLHVGDLSGYDDALHAEQGRAMLYSHDWLTVRHNGLHNPEFPPLFYWLEAVSMKMWGASDFAAKFPSALLGFGTIIAVYLIAHELTGQIWLALISMVVLTTTQYFMKYATHAMTDVPFAFFIAIALLFYLKGIRRPRYLLLSGLAVGLGMLTRPYVGVIPLAIFLSHLLWIRRKDLLWSRHVLCGFALALILPCLWYAVQYRLHGAESIAGPAGLIHQQLVSGGTRDFTSVLAGFLQYPKLLLKLYWPWLPLMVLGLFVEVRKAFRERESASTFLVVWVGWILILFSLGSAKQLRYIMPVLPAFAILAAIPIHRWIPAQRRELCFRWFSVLGLAAILFMHFSPGNRMRAVDMRTLAPVAEAHSRPNQRIVLYTHGARLWNYQNQFLWYANRYTEFPTTLEEVIGLLRADPGVPVIMDRESFRQFKSQIGPSVHLDVLGESELFFCFRAKAGQ